nr:sulfate transport protein [Cyanidioschyzonaceae sp. 1]
MVTLSVVWVNVTIGLPMLYMLIQTGGHLSWSWEILAAWKLSLLCSMVTMMVNGAMGLLAAWGFTHGNWPAKNVWLSVFNLPLSISPVIVALMLHSIYGIHSPIGKWLWRQHVVIPFHFLAIVMASLFVTLPFVVKEIVPILEQVDETQKEAARILGANEAHVFWKISFPYIKKAMIHALISTHCRAMGEFGAVALLSGNISNQTQTLTLLIEQSYKEYETSLAWSVALLLSIWCLCLNKIST